MLTRSLILSLSFLAAFGLIGRASKSEPVPTRRSFSEFPMQLDGWRGRQEPPIDDKALALLNLDEYLTRSYFRDRSAAGLYVGYWQSQRQGESIHSPLNCLPGAGWEPQSKSYLGLTVPTAAGPERSIDINRYVIQKGLDRQLVLYWYQSHGRVVASEYTSKFYLVKDAIQLNRTDAALVRVIVPIAPTDAGEAAAEQQGVRFIKSLFPILSQYLPS